MSALPDRRDSLAGLSLDAILSDKRGGAPTNSRTLFDIIREDPTSKSYYGHKDRKSWKIFRDKLRLKRAGAAWTSSVHIPTSDIPIHATNSNSSSQFSQRGSFMSSSNNSAEDSASDARPQFTRRSSTRLGASAPTPSDSNHHDDSLDISMPNDALPSRSFRPQISRHNSTRMAQREGDESSVDPFEVAREGTRRLAAALAEERVLSAREAVAAQEAAEAAAAAEAVTAPEAAPSEAEAEAEASETVGEASSSEEAQPVRMSLMDLLEETDREMGVEGSKYMMGDYDDEDFDDEEEEEEEAEADGGGIEYNCCVCMVRHKGAAFIPCGHTFCRLCSRELWVQRGNCPLCNNFIVEILDIF
ncbi:hypothetical protein JRO89_XS01G0044600 [Xanthoceras sorbifolium]|uniref:RING-type domain-containing protein n=1 Tax=Xanthoceras sorbifolium TaxID=99658 RepID=A0ABQ8II84_9ROSI|nr:hypothetical protein JRO89_XS01G0044600 [Xanthoceras sorbifolium]